MARTFNGSTDKITCSSPALFTKHVAVIDGVPRFSHPTISQAPNGDWICGYAEGATNQDFKLVRSTDLGDTWSSGSPVTIAAHSGRSNHDGHFCINGSGNLVCVYSSNEDVYCKISTDSGATWGSEITISDHGGTLDSHPEVKKLANNDLICVYTASDVIVKKSTDGGSTWGSAIDTGADGTSPTMAVMSSGRIIIAYQTSVSTGGYFSIFSDDSGATWSTSVKFRGNCDVNANNDVNLMRLNNNDLIALFSVGGEGTANRYGLFMISHDEGRSWVYEAGLHPAADEPHRLNGFQMSTGQVVVVATTKSGGDGDYHVDYLKPPSGWPCPNPHGLQNLTVGGWIRYHGTPNGANDHRIYTKLNQTKQFLIIDGGSASAIYMIVDRSTTDFIMWSTTSVADNTWTYVVAVLNWQSQSNIGKLYRGTAATALADVTSVHENSSAGDIVRDDTGPVIWGGRASDSSVGFKDVLASGFLIGRPLSLNESNGLMWRTRPRMEGLMSYPFYGLSPEPGSNILMPGTVTGSGIYSTRPPTF